MMKKQLLMLIVMGLSTSTFALDTTIKNMKASIAKHGESEVYKLVCSGGGVTSFPGEPRILKHYITDWEAEAYVTFDYTKESYSKEVLEGWKNLKLPLPDVNHEFISVVVSKKYYKDHGIDLPNPKNGWVFGKFELTENGEIGFRSETLMTIDSGTGYKNYLLIKSGVHTVSNNGLEWWVSHIHKNAADWFNAQKFAEKKPPLYVTNKFFGVTPVIEADPKEVDWNEKMVGGTHYWNRGSGMGFVQGCHYTDTGWQDK